MSENLTEELFQYEVITGDEITTTAQKNIYCALNILSEFFDVPTCTFVKNGLMFATALGDTTNTAYLKAFDCDPLSTFGACVAFSSDVDTETARHIKSCAIPMVIAPNYDDNALDILTNECETIVIKLNSQLKEYKSYEFENNYKTPIGTIIEEQRNKIELDKNTFKISTKTNPTSEQIEDAIFAWKTSKYLTPISISVVKDFKTISIFQAQTNAQAGVEYALNYACDSSKEAVLHISDNVITESIIHAAAQARIGLIIYSGGEFTDIKINNLADKYNIAILTTGINF